MITEGGQGPAVEIVQLTPELAHDYMARNTANYRKINEGDVTAMAAAMRRGEFNSQYPSPDAISIDDQGVLTNGQHRCLAVIRSGVTIPVIVSVGGPQAMADAMDTGRKRTAQQILAHHGYNDSAMLASVVRAYGFAMNAYNVRLTNLQILAFVEKHDQQLYVSCHYGRKVETLMSRSLAGGLHFAFAQADAEKAGEFFDRLADGVGLYTGNPIHSLRNRLMRVAPHGRPDPVYLSAIMIKAWNAWVNRRTLAVLKWRGQQSPDEDFPKIVGAVALLGDKERS